MDGGFAEQNWLRIVSHSINGHVIFPASISSAHFGCNLWQPLLLAACKDKAVASTRSLKTLCDMKTETRLETIVS